MTAHASSRGMVVVSSPRQSKLHTERNRCCHKRSVQRFKGVRIDDIGWCHWQAHEIQGHEIGAAERGSKRSCLLRLKTEALIVSRLAKDKDDLIPAVPGALDRASNECGPDALTLPCS